MRRHTRGLFQLTLILGLAIAAACRTDPPPPPAAEQESSATEGTVTPGEPVEAPIPAGGGARLETPPADEQGRPAPAPALRPSPTMGTSSQPGAAGAATSSAGASPAKSAEASPASSSGLPPATARRPQVQLVEVPSGTALPLELTTTVASNTSAVEDAVSARVTRDVEVNGRTAIPAGATVAGRVTHVKASGKVKGVAALTVRFHTLSIAGQSYDISAEPLRHQAQSTRGKDAQKIGIGAGAGAVVGGLLGGRKGAAIGAAAGGAGGTGVVLATRGDEVQLSSGTPLTLRLTEPLAVAIR